jgi:hypothetical protein
MHVLDPQLPWHLRLEEEKEVYQAISTSPTQSKSTQPATQSPACVSEVNRLTLPLGNPEHTPIPSYPSATKTQPGPPCSRPRVKAFCTKSSCAAAENLLTRSRWYRFRSHTSHLVIDKRMLISSSHAGTPRTAPRNRNKIRGTHCAGTVESA